MFRILPFILALTVSVAEAQVWRTEVHYDVVGVPGIELVEGDIGGVGQYYAFFLVNGAPVLGALANEQRVHNIQANCQNGLASRSDYRNIGSYELIAELFQCDQAPHEEYIRLFGTGQIFYLQRR